MTAAFSRNSLLVVLALRLFAALAPAAQGDLLAAPTDAGDALAARIAASNPCDPVLDHPEPLGGPLILNNPLTRAFDLDDHFTAQALEPAGLDPLVVHGWPQVLDRGHGLEPDPRSITVRLLTIAAPESPEVPGGSGPIGLLALAMGVAGYRSLRSDS